MSGVANEMLICAAESPNDFVVIHLLEVAQSTRCCLRDMHAVTIGCGCGVDMSLACKHRSLGQPISDSHPSATSQADDEIREAASNILFT